MNIATERRPSTPLAPYVKALWLVPREAYADNGLTVLPVGHASLALPLDGSPMLVRQGAQPVAAVRSVDTPLLANACTQVRCFALAQGCRAAVIGAHFQPGALPLFVPGSVADMGQEVLPLAQLWGPAVNGWLPRLAAAAETGADSVLAALDELLLRQLQTSSNRPLAGMMAVAALGDPMAPLTVTEAACRNGMTPKQYRQTFSAATGLKPKEYARLARFSAALQRLSPGRGTVTEAAVECLYFDQAHLVHEFKALAGMTPTAYRLRFSRHAAETDDAE